MLETIIVVLLVLWLLGMFGPVSLPALAVGGHSFLHILLVIIAVLVVLRLIGRV